MVLIGFITVSIVFSRLYSFSQGVAFFIGVAGVLLKLSFVFLEGPNRV